MKTRSLSTRRRRRWLAVLGGGFLGAITRYLLSAVIQVALGKALPYDIFVINLSGAFVLALVTVLADITTFIGPTRRLFINVGFLGPTPPSAAWHWAMCCCLARRTDWRPASTSASAFLVG